MRGYAINVLNREVEEGILNVFHVHKHLNLFHLHGDTWLVVSYPFRLSEHQRNDSTFPTKVVPFCLGSSLNHCVGGDFRLEIGDG